MFTNQIEKFPDFGRQGIPDAKPDLTNSIPEIYPVEGQPPQVSVYVRSACETYTNFVPPPLAGLGLDVHALEWRAYWKVKHDRILGGSTKLLVVG